MSDYQTTLKTSLSFHGVGVHNGKPVSIHLHPAEANHGIVFQRIDEGAPGDLLSAIITELGDTELCTTLGNAERNKIATIEHLMAALSGIGIDNLLVQVDGAELPIMDGSALSFIQAIKLEGVRSLSEKRRYIRILKSIRVGSEKTWSEFSPYNGTRFEMEIDFSTPAIGHQKLEFDLTPSGFEQEIASSRTFGFMSDVEKLRTAGLALGASLENTIVIGADDRVINDEGLRYPDEFVRHKLLDAIGDLSLIGSRFIGCYRSYRGGHRLNSEAVKKLLSDCSNYEIIEASSTIDDPKQMMPFSASPFMTDGV